MSEDYFVFGRRTAKRNMLTNNQQLPAIYWQICLLLAVLVTRWQYERLYVACLVVHRSRRPLECDSCTMHCQTHDSSLFTLPPPAEILLDVASFFLWSLHVGWNKYAKKLNVDSSITTADKMCVHRWDDVGGAVVNFGGRWRWAVSLTPRPIYPQNWTCLNNSFSPSPILLLHSWLNTVTIIRRRNKWWSCFVSLRCPNFRKTQMSKFPQNKGCLKFENTKCLNFRKIQDV